MTYSPRTIPGLVAVAGTSLAASVGASSAATGFPAVMQSVLNSLAPWQTWIVNPYGVSGNTQQQIQSRLPAILATHPEWVVFEVSPNNNRADLAIEPGVTIKQVGSTIAQIRASGSKPIPIIDPPINPARFAAANSNSTAYDATSLTRQAAVNRALIAMCRELAVPFADMFAGFAGAPGLMSDGVHPNDTGHGRMGSSIARAITSVLTAVSAPEPVTSRDDFFRANAANLGTALSGQAWTNPTGFSIVGNQASMNSQASSSTSVIDNGAVIGFVSGLYGGPAPTQGNATATANTGLILWWTDANNFGMAYPQTSTAANSGGGLRWGLAVCTAGSFSFFLGANGQLVLSEQIPGGDLIQARLTATTVELIVNGYSQGVIPSTAQATSTKYGIWNGGGSSPAGSALWSALSAA